MHKITHLMTSITLWCDLSASYGRNCLNPTAVGLAFLFFLTLHDDWKNVPWVEILNKCTLVKNNASKIFFINFQNWRWRFLECLEKCAWVIAHPKNVFLCWEKYMKGIFCTTSWTWQLLCCTKMTSKRVELIVFNAVITLFGNQVIT